MAGKKYDTVTDKEKEITEGMVFGGRTKLTN
jgi:hypothetical protein